jgi:hypothetical protein
LTRQLSRTMREANLPQQGQPAESEGQGAQSDELKQAKKHKKHKEDRPVSLDQAVVSYCEGKLTCRNRANQPRARVKGPRAMS